VYAGAAEYGSVLTCINDFADICIFGKFEKPFIYAMAKI
jgi:hypothetical protein